MKNKIPHHERRKYHRLDTIFPVEFQVVDSSGNPTGDWQQAFSQDISKGGMCLTMNMLKREDSAFLEVHKTTLLLQIHSIFSDRSFLAYADVVWVAKTQALPFAQYLVGLQFSKIDHKELDRFLGYIRLKKFLWRILQGLVIGIVCGLSLAVVHNVQLRSRNSALFENYTRMLEKNSVLTGRYKALLDEKDRLEKQVQQNGIDTEILKQKIINSEVEHDATIAALDQQLAQARSRQVQSEEDVAVIEGLKRKLDEMRALKDTEIEKLNKEVDVLKEKERVLKNNLAELVTSETNLRKSVSQGKEEKDMLSQNVSQELYDWVRSHQNQKTGLIVSFEGDHNLRDMSFLYDQALSLLAYSSRGDFENAKHGLNFFLQKAERFEGKAFYNAYYAANGSVAEYIAHAGPNLWLGMAILQYTQKTHDYTYIPVARTIASWIRSLQDDEGGIIGGRTVSWYSTEHNLDAFAFFTMFYEVTHEEHYKISADSVLNWLKKFAYNNTPLPINRGKGDATIATDTYAWSIAAIGPKRLEALSLDCDGIINFAIQNCLVTTTFVNRFGNEVTLNGFDFAKQQHSARGGVVSSEWTAQMVVSLRILADYYAKRGDTQKLIYYRDAALKYLGELNKMIIEGPSAFGQGRWCLPYASQEDVDTGHGWRTPKGKKTGSIAGTVYTIFALTDFNPLSLKQNGDK